MRKRLSARPAPIVHPVGKEKDFRGLIDLVNGQLVTYTDEDMSGKQPLVTPIPAEHEAEYKRGREALIEAIADTSDAIAERYLAGEEVDTPSLKAALRQATIAGQLTPVLCGAALRNKGVQRVLDAVCDYLPSPLDILETRGTHPRTKEPAARPPSPDAPLAALAFKTIADKNGDLTFVRIYSGVLSRGSGVLNPVKDKVERIGRIFRMHAAEREPVEEMRAGDIAAVVGLKHTITGDTLCDPEAPIVLGALTFPEPVISRAVSPKKSDDRDRLADALAKLAKEDPTFKRATDEETGEVIISGMGELHLEVLVNKLRREYRVEVETGAPRVAYRMTLARPVDIEGRHIKQTGGHGQYGVVKVRFEPLAAIDGSVEFEDTIVGGVIPKEYIPSVEKGIRNAAETDRTGFPLVGFKATLWDGSYHEVDSSDLAFQAAGQLSMRMAVEQAGVKLLEPKMRLEVEVPDAYVSGVIADINSRRAEISEIAAGDGDIRYVRGKVPIAEMFGYATTLRSVSQGRGSFSLEPCEYSVVPKAIADKVLEEARKARAR
jgi:elongation factor G